MDDELLKQRVTMIFVVSVQWFTVVVAPLWPASMFSDEMWLPTVFAVLIVVYCFFTGYRAWKRRWKARFILRLAIPAGLLVASCLAAVVRALMS